MLSAESPSKGSTQWSLRLGKKFAAAFIKNLRTEIMQGILDELSQIPPRMYMSESPEQQEEEEE